MRWNEQIDAYCERVGPGFWAEPVNALTNIAFLIAALWLWRQARGLPFAQVLCVILFVIGIGSFLFHTYATRWAAMADSLPILIYILTYILAVNLHVWRWPVWVSVAGMLAFFPYAAVATPLFNALPFFTVSSFYWPVPLLIFVYAALLWRRYPATARGLAIGAAILCASLVFRSLDGGICSHLPLGTHFMWHLLNAVMLGWMIAVYVGHRRREGGVMDVFDRAERLMGMDDAVWLRHANPWSVWTRILTPLPLLALAVWSRVWLGWGALGPVALVGFWIWINPRLFPPPASLDTWSAHAVLGERVWLRARDRVAAHHLPAARALTGLSALGIVPYVWGLWALDPWAVVAGAVIITGAKTWFIDRAAWIWADFLRDGGTLADLERDRPRP